MTHYCEICGSVQCTYRSYTKQWICYTCRLLPEHLYLTLGNILLKYKLSKMILLAAYMFKHHPEKSIATWNFEGEDIQYYTKMKLLKYKGLDMITLPNPHRYDSKRKKNVSPVLLSNCISNETPVPPLPQQNQACISNDQNPQLPVPSYHAPMKLFKDMQVKELCEFLLGSTETRNRIVVYDSLYQNEIEKRKNYVPPKRNHERVTKEETKKSKKPKCISNTDVVLAPKK